MSILRFYGMSHTVVLSENILDIALWVKNPRWPPFVQGQAIDSYHFWYNRRRFVFLVTMMGFSGMPYIVILSENTSHIALWVKHSRWSPFVQGQAINSYHFRHNRDRFLFSVPIMGFSGMPYIVVLSENIFGIALCVKHPIWPPFDQGQAINSYHFRHNRGRLVFFCVYHRVFGYAVHSGVVRKYFRHCIVGKKSKMAAICQRSINKWTSFLTK